MKKLLLIFTAFLSISAMAQTQIQMPISTQSGTFSGSVRGYYFVAPTCFTITGLMVPTDASTGPQSIAVVRFHSNLTPPLYSVTTNAFTTLFLTQNDPTSGIIPVNIQVEQGDVIGILGQRATVNSYGGGSFPTTIDGFPTTVNRLGMQFPLTTTAPQQLWTEAAGSISRVFMYYDSLITYNVTSGPIGPLTEQFGNGADTSFTSSWDFGDGSPLGTGSNPTHTYAMAGTYNVCTYITNTCGTDTLCTSVTVCNPSPAVAGYTSSVAGPTVTFTDGSSNASNWLWDFGDATTSTAQNPSHTYAMSGTYNVCQIAYNGTCDADTICTSITVCVAPTVTYTSMDMGGGLYMFNDTTTGATSWAWDFGDGSPIGTTQDPSHTYAVNGTYTVCVTAYGCDSTTYCNTVVVCMPTVANYTSTSSMGMVMFTDASAHATSWAWDFGDASPVDNTQNPMHTYATNGVYTVCLIATGCSGSDTTCTMITVCPEALSAAFTSTDTLMNATFSNGSMSASSYLWDFGDASTDTAANPSHTYAATGQYLVCLTAWNICGDSATTCDTILLIILDNNSMTTGSTIDLYPNPANEVATVNVSSVIYSGNYVFEMFDAAGKLVRTQNGVFGQNMNVDRSGLEGGIYIYKISVDQNVVGNGRLIFTQ